MFPASFLTIDLRVEFHLQGSGDPGSCSHVTVVALCNCWFLALTKCLSLEDAEENLEPSAQVSKQCDPSLEEAGSGSRLMEGQTENGTAQARPSEEKRANKSQILKVRHGREARTLWGSYSKGGG